jgi:hypothetical protein
LHVIGDRLHSSDGARHPYCALDIGAGAHEAAQLNDALESLDFDLGDLEAGLIEAVMSNEPRETIWVGRLGNLTIESGFTAATLMSHAGDTADCINSGLLERSQLAQVLTGDVSIRLRHFDVQENDIRPECFSHRQRLLTVLRGANGVSGCLQYQREHLP